MKRFLKTFVLLVIGLFLLASGFDAALERFSNSPNQSTVVIYNEQGQVVLAYTGDLSAAKAAEKTVVPRFLHRT